MSLVSAKGRNSAKNNPAVGVTLAGQRTTLPDAAYTTAHIWPGRGREGGVTLRPTSGVPPIPIMTSTGASGFAVSIAPPTCTPSNTFSKQRGVQLSKHSKLSNMQGLRPVGQQYLQEGFVVLSLSIA